MIPIERVLLWRSDDCGARRRHITGDHLVMIPNHVLLWRSDDNTLALAVGISVGVLVLLIAAYFCWRR